MIDNVKKVFKEYVENVLKGKRLLVESTKIAELITMVKENLLESIIQDIENNPDNLIYYLRTDKIGEKTRQEIIDYFIHDEVLDLLNEVLIRPDMWVDFNDTLKNIFNLDDLLKISIAMQNDLEIIHDEEEINSGVVKTFLEDCLRSPYGTSLQVQEEFYTLAQKYTSYADSYNILVKDILKVPRSIEDVKKLEAKFLNNPADYDTVRLLVNFQNNLSKDFTKSLSANYLEIISQLNKIKSSIPGLYQLLENATNEFSTTDIINICDKAKENNQLDLLISFDVCKYFGEKTKKFIFNYLHDDIVNYLSNNIKLSRHDNYYANFLSDDDIKKIFENLKAQVGVEELKKHDYSSLLNSSQASTLFTLLKADLEKEAVFAITNGDFLDFVKNTDIKLVKKIISDILMTLINTTLATGDISFFCYEDADILFNNAQIMTIATYLQDLFMPIEVYPKIWKKIRKCYSKADTIKAVMTLIEKNDYSSAYALAKNDKIDTKSINIITKKIAADLMKNIKLVKEIPIDMLNDLPEDLALEIVDAHIEKDYSYVCLMPLNTKKIMKIRDYVVLHYQQYSITKIFAYIKLVNFSWDREKNFLNYVVDLWYENYFPDFNALKGIAKFPLENIAHRASFHREILLKYLLNPDTVKTPEIITLIKGDKTLSDFYELPENKLFKLNGYELNGYADYFKLCDLYKKSKLSIKAFCITYFISPASGFAEFLKILSKIDASELKEINSVKATAATKFYYGMMTTASKVINGEISMDEYFTSNPYKFKNQKVFSVINNLRTKKEKNTFTLKFLEYVVEKKNSYLPYSVMEFLNFKSLKPDEVFKEYFKSNLILPKDKKYYALYHDALKFITLNTKRYVRRTLYMEFMVNGIYCKIDDDTIDKAYVYLKNNNYCISQINMLKATREIAMGKIQVTEEVKEYKEELVTEIVETIKECHSLEDYILMCKDENSKLCKTLTTTDK